MKYIPYSRQSISKKDIDSVIKILKSEFITQGPMIQRFENKIASFVHATYAVAFSSGTAALHGAYFASGLGKNDELITTPMTFVATANAALYLGAKPVFCDIDKHTGNIDIKQIEKHITKKTKVIAPVHYSGMPVDLKAVYKLAKKNNLIVVDDASHALGASTGNAMIGSGKYSDMTVFSFHPVKHITTGEGGAVVTNNKKYYEKLLLFRNHGITKNESFLINKKEGPWYYEMHELGFNYRITDMQAALGINQLQRLSAFIKKRQQIAKIYSKKFKDNPFFDILESRNGDESIYHLYPILLKDHYKKKKKEIFTLLRENKLGVQTHYIPVYYQPYYQELGYKKGLCPAAEDFYEREISIPLHQSMTPKEISYVINTLYTVCNNI